jgi:CxxC-x17-CxxC domain-containing protein
MEFTDKTLACLDCGVEFTFTAGEQEFYYNKGFQNEPKRCPDCRANKKREKKSTRTDRQFYTVTCADCGQETKVPFEPRQGKPVYCRDCYDSKKVSV